MNTQSCDMTRVDPPASASAWDLAVGEFYFRTDLQEQRWMTCMLPGDTLAFLPIRPLLNVHINGGHSWEFDGNEDSPTLTPSVNAEGQWHGFITAGRAVSC